MNNECMFLQCLIPTDYSWRRILGITCSFYVHTVLILEILNKIFWLQYWYTLLLILIVFECNFFTLRFVHFLHFSNFKKKIFELNFTLQYFNSLLNSLQNDLLFFSILPIDFQHYKWSSYNRGISSIYKSKYIY